MAVRPKNILLVDDEKSFLLSLSEGLKITSEDFKIFIAENGREALEIFRSGLPIDVMVTDLNMPEMNGFELLGSVKKDFSVTRVIVLTGCLTPEIKKRLNTIGNYVCMEKTTSLDRLWREIIHELGFSF